MHEFTLVAEERNFTGAVWKTVAADKTLQKPCGARNSGRMTREQLIELVQRIVAVDGTEEEIERMLDIFESQVPYPGAFDLIYWDDRNLSAEKIVDEALSHKPITLPPSTASE